MIGLALLRIAWRDARTILYSRTYLLLMLAPLVLFLLVGLLVAAGVAAIVFLKINTPESAPLGHDNAAIVLQPGAGPGTRQQFETLAEFLQQPAPAAVQEARLFKNFLIFILEARAGGAVTGKEGLNAAITSTESGLTVEEFPDGNWDEICAQVPERFDAALLILEEPGGGTTYRMAYEGKLLFSRAMNRRLQDRVQAFNLRNRGEEEATGVVNITVVDRRDAQADLWTVRILAVLLSFSIAFSFHSVGVQSVATAIAGERESRTLEVLLSLPITRRLLLYGKLLGLVITTAVPTLFWSSILWIGLQSATGLALSPLRLACMQLGLLAALMAVACAVSATSPNMAAAKNRLGLVNMGVFGLGSLALVGPPLLWPDQAHPLAPLIPLVTSRDSGWEALSVTAALLVMTWVTTEIGHAFFQRA